MKQIKIDVKDAEMEISHIGLTDVEVIGAMTAALWKLELSYKMSWSNPIKVEVEDAQG